MESFKAYVRTFYTFVLALLYDFIKNTSLLLGPNRSIDLL